jgi:hypothetical protein
LHQERSSIGFADAFSETMIGCEHTVEIWADKSMPEAELPTMTTFCNTA